MESSQINVNLQGMKAKLKNELYKFLITKADVYLPTQKETSIYILLETLFTTGKENAWNIIWQKFRWIYNRIQSKICSLYQRVESWGYDLVSWIKVRS